MFLQVSVRLWRGGVHPTLGRHPLLGRHPPEQTPPETATAAAGTHPTEMHSSLHFFSPKSTPTINNSWILRGLIRQFNNHRANHLYDLQSM